MEWIFDFFLTTSLFDHFSLLPGQDPIRQAAVKARRGTRQKEGGGQKGGLSLFETLCE